MAGQQRRQLRPLGISQIMPFQPFLIYGQPSRKPAAEICIRCPGPAFFPAEGEQQDSFEAMGDGLTFWTDPFNRDTELTGPAAASLTISSTTTRAECSSPCGCRRGLPLMAASGSAGCGSSLRTTDPGRSQPYRPWQTFDERQPLQPGVPVDVDIEIWPFSVIFPRRHRLGVSVFGRDFEFPGDGPWPTAYGVSMRGNAIFVHTDGHDHSRPEFRGTTTLYGGEARSRLLLPFLDR